MKRIVSVLALGALLSGCLSLGTDRPLPISQALTELSIGLLRFKPGTDGIAVMEFETLGTAGGNGRFGLYLADGLSTRMGEIYPGAKLLERLSVEKIAEEQNLNYYGDITEEKIRNLQELTPARFIVMGAYAVMGETIEVNARMVDVRGGVVVSSARRVLRNDPSIKRMAGTGSSWSDRVLYGE